jgi:LysM repeat protein
MTTQSSRSSGRFLAPAALAVCAVAVLVVIGSSLGGGDSSGGGSVTETATQQRTGNAQAPRREPASYTIKAGDTLGAISEQTGISVEMLQQLNPELDPQALIAGQKIKLRE